MQISLGKPVNLMDADWQNSAEYADRYEKLLDLYGQIGDGANLSEDDRHNYLTFRFFVYHEMSAFNEFGAVGTDEFDEALSTIVRVARWAKEKDIQDQRTEVIRTKLTEMLQSKCHAAQEYRAYIEAEALLNG